MCYGDREKWNEGLAKSPLNGQCPLFRFHCQTEMCCPFLDCFSSTLFYLKLVHVYLSHFVCEEEVCIYLKTTDIRGHYFSVFEIIWISAC